MPIIVEVPGIGNVEFPDDTSPEQMARTVRLHVPEPAEKGSAEWVKWRNFRAKDVVDEAHARDSDPKKDDKGFLHGFGETFTPIEALKGMWNMATGLAKDPLKTMLGIAAPVADEMAQAGNAWDKGDVPGVVAHGLASIPLVGPGAIKAGTDIGEGRWGEGLGEASGLLLGATAHHVIPKVLGPQTRAIVGGVKNGVAAAVPGVVNKMNSRSPRPLSPEAVAKAKELGIPLSEGARSGSTFTQGVEKILGSTVAADLYENHTTAGQAGIEKGVNQLANGFGTDQFAAGQSAIDGLQQHSKQHHDAAQAGYSQIADAEAAPENQRDVVQGTKTVRTQAGSVLGPDGRPVQPGGVQEVPIIERVGLPVDTQPVRPYLQSLYNELEQEYAPSRQLADPIFHSLGQLLKGKRYVSASVMEKFLGAMKKVQREGAGRKTFLAGKIIDAMSPAVDTAVDQASGSGSLFGDSGSLSDTLRESREHWREHAETQELLEDLSGDTTGKSGQTRAAKTLLRPADAAFPMLQKVLARAPGAAEALRQALMGEIFKSAESGEFTNPSAAANKFAQIGKRTKAALFAPEQLSDTQAVLELAKRLGENPAKGGAGVLGALVKAGVILAHPVQGATALVFGRRFAKVLFNPEGAAALRTAMSGGPGAPAALAAVETLASETPKGGTPPQGTPPADPFNAQHPVETATDEAGDTVSQPPRDVPFAEWQQHQAPPEAAPPEAAPPEAPPAKSFETSKGSRYDVAGEGTARFKATTGEKFDSSDQTVYIEPDVNMRLMEELQANNTGNLRASVRRLEDGQIGLVVKDRATGEIRNDLSKTIPVTSSPEVGLHPVELWHKNPETGDYGFHVGHAIRKIISGEEAPPEAPPAAAPAPTPPPAPQPAAPAAAAPKLKPGEDTPGMKQGMRSWLVDTSARQLADEKRIQDLRELRDRAGLEEMPGDSHSSTSDKHALAERLIKWAKDTFDHDLERQQAERALASVGGRRAQPTPPPEAPPAPAPTPPPAPRPAAPAAKATPPPAPEPEVDMFGNPIEQTPEPGTVKEMHPSEIEADPVRFQYKRDTGGKDGVGDELKGVNNYDPELGGVLSVWHDPANGKTYVVNGHHRLELAKRAGAGKVTVRYLDAADANTARTKGAIINIAEGRGTAVDAAKVFRDTGMDEKQLGEKGVSLTGKVAKDGVNLSKLSPSIFDKVVQGDLTVERGSLIGELLPVEADQHAAMAMLDRAEKGGKSLTNGQFREAIDLVRGAPKRLSAPSENGMLFGEMEADPQEESLVLEMASVSDYIRKKLQGEKRLFAAVADSGKAEALQKAGNSLVVDRNAEIADGANRHLAAYDKLKASAGPINDALRNAAKSSSPKGAPINEIRNHAYERVRAEIRKTLGEGAKEPKD